MATLDTIDDNLREEVFEECGRYGLAINCVIFVIKDAPEEDSVRIFVEFERKESAIKAYAAINGRFFAGRTVMVKFYDEKLFSKGKYDA